MGHLLDVIRYKNKCQNDEFSVLHLLCRWYVHAHRQCLDQLYVDTHVLGRNRLGRPSLLSSSYNDHLSSQRMQKVLR